MTSLAPAFPISRRFIAACCTLVFCAFLCVPAGTRLLNLASSENLAEATSSPLPAFAWNLQAARALGKALAGGWLEKNFPFRGTLIRWYNYTSATVFGSIGPAAPVTVGKDGWLFLARDRTLDLMEEHRALHPLSEAQMASLAKGYQERHDWLASRGIRYMVAVAPNKNSVYPEFLPKSHAQAGPVSRLDQIMTYLREKTRLNVLDLREPLLEAKKDVRVFYSTDSHWNAHGGFAAYRAMAQGLHRDFPSIRPMTAEDFLAQEFTFLGGDLSVMVGIKELVTENKVYLIPIKPLKAVGQSTGILKPGYNQEAQASRVDDTALPKALFFHDSYFWELMPLLGEHFSRAVYVWVRPALDGSLGLFDRELIEAEKPDVVVEQIAERFFIPAAVKARLDGEGGK